VVIHLVKEFAAGFADWLDGVSKLRVRYALDGEPLPRLGDGEVIMAPPGWHLIVSSEFPRLTTGPERNSCRPSIDVLFESVARVYGSHAAACLLTGMGADGATGLLSVRRSGGLTIAQHEASSVVFGMPRAAIERGAAEMILPLAEFAQTLRCEAGMDADEER
jgi:two-component system, chemotaxis family, protein-glutamate methylesterase/glutaminase